MMFEDSLKQLIDDAKAELEGAESYFNNCDPDCFEDALENLNNKRKKLDLLYAFAKIE